MRIIRDNEALANLAPISRMQIKVVLQYFKSYDQIQRLQENERCLSVYFLMENLTDKSFDERFKKVGARLVITYFQ